MNGKFDDLRKIPREEFLDKIDPVRPHRDFEGNPISLREWMVLFDDPRRMVAQDHVGSFLVSTVWIGIDHAYEGPPLIFETMVFDESADRPYRDLDCVRYSTWDEAVAGHAAALEKLKLVEEWGS